MQVILKNVSAAYTCKTCYGFVGGCHGIAMRLLMCSKWFLVCFMQLLGVSLAVQVFLSVLSQILSLNTYKRKITFLNKLQDLKYLSCL